MKGGRQTDWYDDALFYYAEWMNSTGSINQLDSGEWQQEPDYVKALELYRRITKEFAKGETRYFDQAVERIKEITGPTVTVSVSNIFLPESELQFSLEARNLKVVVDPQNQVAELHDDNNVLEANNSARPCPDLAIKSIKRDKEGLLGETYRPKVTIINRGNAPSPSCQVWGTALSSAPGITGWPV